jgi:hypothetical protein
MSAFPSAPPPDAAFGGHDAWSAPAPTFVSYNQSMQKLDKFKVGDDVEVFLERFVDYCDGIGLPATLRASRLLSYLDSTTYKIISKELKKEERQDTQTVAAHLMKRFSPSHSSGHLRYNFRNIKQQPSETLQSYYTTLLDKGMKAFEGEDMTSIEKNLIDQFIYGLNDSNVQLHVIKNRNQLTTLKEVLDSAISYKESLNFHSELKSISPSSTTSSTEATVAEVTTSRRGRSTNRGQNRGDAEVPTTIGGDPSSAVWQLPRP